LVFPIPPSTHTQVRFHGRSCQALQSRRLRGALCLAARTPPRKPESNLLDSFCAGVWNSDWDGSDAGGGALLGSAECSFHEFFGTRLGRRRPRNSILYVTEVAVNPSARRRGIGTRLLQAVDVVATVRGAETLYLHVDAANRGAMALYERAGYRVASLDESVFMEFTTSLNLHPGATKGRDHFLLYKDLRPATWLDDGGEVDVSNTSSPHEKTLVGQLGFEIPA